MKMKASMCYAWVVDLNVAEHTVLKYLNIMHFKRCN